MDAVIKINDESSEVIAARAAALLEEQRLRDFAESMRSRVELIESHIRQSLEMSENARPVNASNAS